LSNAQLDKSFWAETLVYIIVCDRR